MLPEAKEIPAIDKASFNRLLNEALNETDEELDKGISDPKNSMIKKWIRKVIRMGFYDGDIHRLQGLLDRAIGRVKNEVEHSGSVTLESLIVGSKENEDK